MLAFLAIVANEDLRRGIIEPSYVLCRSKSSAERTGYVMVKADNDRSSLPKVLFRHLTNDDEFIHFLSNYRAREYANEERSDGFRKKYHPIGALFWFPCDEYGNRDATQPPLFIKRVPDKKFPMDGTKQILERELANKDNDLYRLTNSPFEIEMPPLTSRTYPN